ncbi:TPM domain-containing protein [Sulfurospirillum arcachonense]|uniref:TPM domain-containing protein n=1 Tax=Sulfurospirillum arcachonense TaxID=57666 RepID=UPI0004B59BAA|nr:TPM domain-containing protein [Sulfurospirillum arcachonense]
MISKLNDIKRRVFLLCALFLSISAVANASFVVVNDEIISQKVTQKINTMGSELFTNTGISVYVALPQSLEKKSIFEYEKEISLKLRKPYVLLTIAKNEEQLDILYTQGLEKRFDKEAVLSPFPWSGTILPILTQKKENDQYNAATLNGYADIVEQIAKSYNVKLQSAIGNTNKNIYLYLKIIIYGFLLIVIGKYLYKKMGKR